MMENSKLSKTEFSYFRAAESISMLSKHRCQVGCVVVNKHRIVSSGYNSKNNGCSIQKQLDDRYFGDSHSCGRRHAEVDALYPLIKNGTDLSRATLYIFRRTRNGQLTTARPCPRCMSVIKQQGIKRLKYTTQDGYASEVLR